MDRVLAGTLGIAGATLTSEAVAQTGAALSEVPVGAAGSWTVGAAAKWMGVVGLVAAGGSMVYFGNGSESVSSGTHAVQSSEIGDSTTVATTAAAPLEKVASTPPVAEPPPNPALERDAPANERAESGPREENVPPSPKGSSPARTPERSKAEGQTGSGASHDTQAESESQLAIELRLIGQADRRLRSGDAAGALAALDEHQSRFAHGQLQQERRGLRLLAGCSQQGDVRARRAARKFASSHPQSPLAHRMEKECGLDD